MSSTGSRTGVSSGIKVDSESGNAGIKVVHAPPAAAEPRRRMGGKGVTADGAQRDSGHGQARQEHPQIAAELGRSPTTIARVLKEPVDKPPPKRRRRSKVESYRRQIEHGIGEGLSNVRILERAR